MSLKIEGHEPEVRGAGTADSYIQRHPKAFVATLTLLGITTSFLFACLESGIIELPTADNKSAKGPEEWKEIAFIDAGVAEERDYAGAIEYSTEEVKQAVNPLLQELQFAACAYADTAFIPALPKREGYREISDLFLQYRNANVGKSPIANEDWLSRKILMRQLAGLELRTSVANFEIVPVISETQRCKLACLRDFLCETAKLNITNTFFLFEAEGIYGINFINEYSSPIGIHVKLLEGEFEEAQATLIHEIAHTGTEGAHGIDFVARQEVINSAVRAGLVELLMNPSDSKIESIIEIRKRWNEAK